MIVYDSHRDQVDQLNQHPKCKRLRFDSKHMYVNHHMRFQWS